MAGMSDRRGTEEFARTAAGEEGTGVEVAAATPGPATPKATVFRFKLDVDFDEVVVFVVRATAATAGGTELQGSSTPSRRARRSSRDSEEAAETLRFLERESFGAIAMDNSSDDQVSKRNAES